MPKGVYQRKPFSQKTRKKMSLNSARFWFGKHLTMECKRKKSMILIGKPWSEARKRAQKPAKPKKYASRGKEYSESWIVIRAKIYRRDNWTCRECGVKCHNNIKAKIQCHHIDYNIMNNADENLITLCASCHCKTNFKKEDWIEYYRLKME